MTAALTLLAQKVKITVETGDNKTWQGLTSTLCKRSKRKEEEKEEEEEQQWITEKKTKLNEEWMTE